MWRHKDVEDYWHMRLVAHGSVIVQNAMIMTSVDYSTGRGNYLNEEGHTPLHTAKLRYQSQWRNRPRSSGLERIVSSLNRIPSWAAPSVGVFTMWMRPHRGLRLDRYWINVLPRRFVAPKVAASSLLMYGPPQRLDPKPRGSIKLAAGADGQGWSKQPQRLSRLHGGFSTKKGVYAASEPAKIPRTHIVSLCPTKSTSLSLRVQIASSPSPPSGPLPKTKEGVLRWLVWGACSAPAVPRRGEPCVEMCFVYSTSRRVFASAPAQRGTGGRCRCMARMAGITLTSDLAGVSEKAPRLRVATGELNRSIIGFSLKS
ncbi:hypothetical protein BDP55DRAFT_636846 [Colletotrichum godetiae]|uniref:Uncharacterized protein n=1 Tax=Colletotrichum godetiae TaxID=1209918 RepID=A0AAJ0ESI4_9PEZI|nr:uncharacterized protein BDP55DRAFT_636846 [Colletotrichum godetiae]KAK1659538.1 hypothetical protein BDP55DRAFT_636846 [Colletotrichum godetiae]